MSTKTDNKKKNAFPEKLISLHTGEEFLRGKSIASIQEADDLAHHAKIIEQSMDLFDYFGRQYIHASEDELTIQLLGVRLFNGSASVMKLLLSGYYQTAALQLRDMLETVFLLDYFSTDTGLIATWRNVDKKSEALFKPIIIRKALDDRDGFTGRKREAAYKLLCKLAGHPTFEGFRMVRPIPAGDAHYGPFFEATAMRAVLSEAAKIIVEAGLRFYSFFKCKTRSDYETKLHFMEAQGMWFETFFGHPHNQVQLDEIRALLKIAPL